MSSGPASTSCPWATPLRKAIYEVAGGIKGGKQLKAVVPGGASCPVLRADEIDIGLDFDQMAQGRDRCWARAGLWCWTRRSRIVEFALRTIKFYQHESCGWCIPCREGTDWIKKTLTRVYEGGGAKKDIDNVQYLAENMMGRTFCPLGDAAAMPTLGFVEEVPQGV